MSLIATAFILVSILFTMYYTAQKPLLDISGRQYQSPSSNSHGYAAGTFLYMSPEQSRGKGCDHKTDIYALGVIFFELNCPLATESERFKVWWSGAHHHHMDFAELTLITFSWSTALAIMTTGYSNPYPPPYPKALVNYNIHLCAIFHFLTFLLQSFDQQIVYLYAFTVELRLMDTP